MNDQQLQYNTTEEVRCSTKTLKEVFELPLAIPDYQRDYCWGQKELQSFIVSLKEIPEHFHLGTIILHTKKDEKNYYVIDGQQRLTTLTIYLVVLGYAGKMPLLKQRYESEQSENHIAYAKYFLEQNVQRMSSTQKKTIINNLINNIQFSVLELAGDNLDLAYTFFSNQNSKGVKLSDYDLLKAHHLRYISSEAQMEHLATRWNADIQNEESYSNLQRTLGVHLYRLRHWLRKRYADEYTDRHIRDEFVAAPIMRSIPPFGERFVYDDKIQGGSHFFAYTSNFISEYKRFKTTTEVTLLHNHLCWSSHSRYADVIEQASSPTFFFAEALSVSTISVPIPNTIDGIRKNYYDCLRNLYKELLKTISDEDIIGLIKQEYPFTNGN